MPSSRVRASKSGNGSRTDRGRGHRAAGREVVGDLVGGGPGSRDGHAAGRGGAGQIDDHQELAAAPRVGDPIEQAHDPARLFAGHLRRRRTPPRPGPPPAAPGRPTLAPVPWPLPPPAATVAGPAALLRSVARSVDSPPWINRSPIPPRSARRCAATATWPMSTPPRWSSSPPGWASRCSWRAPPGSARPSWPRPSPPPWARRLIRLQCYEGLDEAKALYEWNYRKQLLRIQADRGRALGGGGGGHLHRGLPPGPAPAGSDPLAGAGRAADRRDRQDATRSSRRCCSRSCPSSRSRSPSWARSRPPPGRSWCSPPTTPAS